MVQFHETFSESEIKLTSYVMTRCCQALSSIICGQTLDARERAHRAFKAGALPLMINALDVVLLACKIRLCGSVHGRATKRAVDLLEVLGVITSLRNILSPTPQHMGNPEGPLDHTKPDDEAKFREGLSGLAKADARTRTAGKSGMFEALICAKVVFPKSKHLEVQINAISLMATFCG